MARLKLARRIAGPGTVITTQVDEELQRFEPIVQALPQKEPAKPNHENEYDVIIVGAGASGIGAALMLIKGFDLNVPRLHFGRGAPYRRTVCKVSPSFV